MYMKYEVPKPKEDEAKEKHWKHIIKEMKIIDDSIKDQLMPQVSSKMKPKQMYDTISKMYEGKNINIKMNLRAQLKSTKMSKGESIQNYFTRVS